MYKTHSRFQAKSSKTSSCTAPLWLLVMMGGAFIAAMLFFTVSFALASANSVAKNVFVTPVVVPKLELGDVERQILCADLVERANNAPLKDRPKAFNRVGVDRADNVLAGADLLGNRAPNKGFKNVAAHGFDDASYNLTLAADRADNGRLAGPHTATTAAALIPMPVPSLSADECLVHFDDPHELAEILIRETCANPMAHVPSGFVRTKTHIAHDLKGADPLLARQHQVNHAEPLAHRLIGIFEDRIDQYREPIAVATSAACVANPMERAGMRFDFRISATWADDELGPAMLGEVQLASIVIREHRLKIPDGHLVDAFFAGHACSPLNVRENIA